MRITMAWLRSLAACAALAATLCPAALAQTPVQVPPDAAYTQAASGMTFPPSVGAFQRLSVTRFADDGTNEAAGYRLTTAAGHIEATVYVSPSGVIYSVGSPRDVIETARATVCRQDFQQLGQMFESFYSNATQMRGEETVLSRSGADRRGYKISFGVTSPSAFGDVHPPLRSETYFFCYVGGRWTVKYRFTYAETLVGEARGAIDQFMRDLEWTIPAER